MREFGGTLRQAECHPDRKHFARRLCEQCYNREYFRRYYADPEHRARLVERARDYGKRWYGSLRDTAIDKLGGRCVNCGIDDRRALCFDHMNGDGHKDRATGKDPKKMFQEILAGKRDDLQLLCANCNMVKAQENGETRHGPVRI